MLPACLTTLLWSFCAVASRRSVEQLGENAANFWRILLAVAVLGLVSHLNGIAFHAEAFGFLFLSGLVGFGLGDLGLYYALSRLGSRLTLLLAQCGAVPIAFFLEWQWLGTTLRWGQAGAVLVVLSGITLALLPRRGELPEGAGRRFWAGVGFGVVAAIGQGAGGVFSRLAYEAQGTFERGGGSVLENIFVGAQAGYQRLLGGFLIIALAFAWDRWRSLGRVGPILPRAGDSRQVKTGWVALNAFSGPILGVALFQWALTTTPAAIVQSIVALTPIVVIPMAWLMEGDRPRPRALVGAAVAVAGVILLALV
ncbi:MAG: DMT family transporter [Opitutales bacterium]